MIPKHVIERFWTNVNKSGPTHSACGQCWEWTGSRFSSGYGRLYGFGRAHRLSWRIHFGEIPNGLLICHHCDNKLCVNPDHLFAGTHLDNMQDGVDKHRFASGDRHSSRTRPETKPRGEHHWNCRLSNEEVELIREFYVRYSRKLGGEALARMFNVSPSTILGIAEGTRRRPCP